MSSHFPRCWSPALLQLAIFLFLVEAHAQDLTPSLTLAAALQRAAEGNASLAAQNHNERAAEALVEQASLKPNPNLEIAAENVLGTGRVQGVRDLETTVQASQAWERGGKREKRVALALAQRDIAAKESAVRRAEVLAATAAAYVEALAAQQRVAFAGEPLRLAREVLAAVDSRVAAGAGSSVESARARAAIAGAQAELTRAQASLAGARTALAAKWTGTTAEALALSGRIRVPDALPAEDSFMARLERHPQMDLLQAHVAARRAGLDLEQGQAVQDVTLSGGVRFLRDGTDAAVVAGVSFPLPVRNRNQGNVRAAREYLLGAEQATYAATIALRAAVAAAWQDLQAAHGAAQNLRREALPATEEAHAVVRRAYDQGQLPLIDVLDVQRSLIAVRREILDAEATYAIALVRLEGLADPTFSTTNALLSSP